MKVRVHKRKSKLITCHAKKERKEAQIEGKKENEQEEPIKLQ